MLTNNKPCRILMDSKDLDLQLWSSKLEVEQMKEIFKECRWRDVKCGDVILV